MERRDCAVLSIKISPTPVSYGAVSERNPSLLDEQDERKSLKCRYSSPQLTVYLRG